MKQLLQLAGAIALLSASAGILLVAVHGARMLDSWAMLPDQVGVLRSAVEDLPDHVLPPVLKEVDRQASGIRRDVSIRIDTALDLANTRIGDALDRYDATLHLVDIRSSAVVDTAAGLRSDLKPTLDASAAAIKDGQDSWDDSYNDVRGLLQSGTVAATQTAQTLEVVRQKAPKFAEDVTGIASDFHDATHSLDMKFFHPGPKTGKQKVLDFLKDFLPLASLVALRTL